VYTEATMEHFNDSITAGEKGFRNSRSSLVFVPKAKSSDATQQPSLQKEKEPRRRTTPLATQTVVEEEEEERVEEQEFQGKWQWHIWVISHIEYIIHS